MSDKKGPSLDEIFGHVRKIYLTPEEFAELPEYSATLPTGFVVGKRWKRRFGLGFRDQLPVGRDKGLWMIGEYMDPAVIRGGLLWYRPIIRVPMV